MFYTDDLYEDDLITEQIAERRYLAEMHGDSYVPDTWVEAPVAPEFTPRKAVQRMQLDLFNDQEVA